MENLKYTDTLQKLGDYTTYIEDLMSSYTKNDTNKVQQIFDELDSNLEKHRNSTKILALREMEKSDGPVIDLDSFTTKETLDLQNAFEDNLALFHLASVINYQPVMNDKFKSMMHNLKDIRHFDKVKVESDKKVLENSKTHAIKIQKEETRALKIEIMDLLKLYNIANEAEYEKGKKLILGKLHKIDPSLFEQLEKKKKSSRR